MRCRVTDVALQSTETELAWTGASRDAVLARYRRLRAISRVVNSAAMDALPREGVTRIGRRLGLFHGKRFELESLDEMDFVFDLLIYTAPPGETRPIDRCARKVGFVPGSDEAMMLGAMRASRFAMVRVERRHEVAGLILADMVRGGEIWLMDEGMESSLANGSVFVTRLHEPEAFCMTAGVVVPLDSALLAEALERVPYLQRKSEREAVEDRRFAEAIYRVALEHNICDRVRFEDAPAQDGPDGPKGASGGGFMAEA